MVLAAKLRRWSSSSMRCHFSHRRLGAVADVRLLAKEPTQFCTSVIGWGVFESGRDPLPGCAGRPPIRPAVRLNRQGRQRARDSARLSGRRVHFRRETVRPDLFLFFATPHVRGATQVHDLIKWSQR